MRYLIRKDRKKQLYFAPLQGITAQAILSETDRKSLTSIVYNRVKKDGSTEQLRQSDAAMLALIDTGSFWRICVSPARLLPKKLRDRSYDWFTRNRDKFEKGTVCQIPSPAEHSRILP